MSTSEMEMEDVHSQAQRLFEKFIKVDGEHKELKTIYEVTAKTKE